MHERLLSILRCPVSGSRLRLEDGAWVAGEIESGALVAESGGASYPIVRGVPRFVTPDNYAANFGVQWNRFRATQLDSHSGLSISASRFFEFTQWHSGDLHGKWVLDAGCGAGRFAEVALGLGLEVVAIDYSIAVDACRANLGHHPRLHVLQADIYHLPFAPASFGGAYSLGVLQHTPQPRAAFEAVCAQLAPGGRIAVDVYPKLLLNILWPKYWLRPFTRRLPADRLLRLVEWCVPFLLPISRAVSLIPVVGRRLRYVVPVVNYETVYPLSPRQLREWAVLDTFDMLSPAHDHPQSAATLRGWFAGAGLEDVQVERRGFLVGRGRRAEVDACA